MANLLRVIKALKKVLAEELLPVAMGYKLQKKNNDWSLLDPEGNIIVNRFIHMYQYKKDPQGILSLIHPEDLPKELRKKGLGVSSYLALAKYYGRIRSDTSLTEDGEKVWKRLLSQGAYVISWDIEYDTKEKAFKALERYYGDVSPDAYYDEDTNFVRFELRG